MTTLNQAAMALFEQPDFSWLIETPPAGANIIYCYGGGCGGPVLSPNWNYYIDIYPPVVSVDHPLPELPPTTAVPLPGTLLLLAAGLLAMRLVKS